MKSTRCPHCRLKNLPPGYRLHPECVDGWLSAQNAKKAAKQRKEQQAKAKVERAVTKARKKALETIPELTKRAQVEFNKWVRARDRHKVCISCGAFPPDLNVFHAGRDAGHYRSVGAAKHLRFTEDNCHAQCVACNQWGAGKAVDYRIGLVARIGIERVEAIETDNTIKRWTRDELRAIAAHYKERRKQLEKEQA